MLGGEGQHRRGESPNSARAQQVDRHFEAGCNYRCVGTSERLGRKDIPGEGSKPGTRRRQDPQLTITPQALACSPATAAAMLSVSARTLQRSIAEGKIEARHVSGRTLVNAAYEAILRRLADGTVHRATVPSGPRCKASRPI
jgi:hypothetical protein